MLKININDVILVIESMKYYLIGFAIIALLAIIISITVRKKVKEKKYMIRKQAVVATLLAFVIMLNLVCFGPLESMISLATGNGKISDETQVEATELANTIMEEGIVLLKNDDAMLPMTDTKVLNVFGWASTNPVYGGSGSGGLSDNYPKISLLEGLNNAGFSTNTELSDFYASYMADRPAPAGVLTPNLTLPEPPVSAYSKEILDNAKAFSDTAVIVISRIGGEGADLCTDVGSIIDGTWADGSSYKATPYVNNSNEYDDFAKGEHYLELSKTERDMVDLVCSEYNKVVVVYNGANTIELGWVDQYEQIKSVLWCPGTGQSGFNALGEILRGEINPSAKTTDTFVYDLTKTPTFNNVGCFIYDNMDEFIGKQISFFSGEENLVHPSFVNYVEGIYVGYKYYETASAEGAINYSQEVQYPFGYGLSYTSFEQKMGALHEADDVISIDVTVTNTGSVAGKDVVEVYYNPPYTNGGIEKSSANLVAFDKTDMLEPGESQTLTLTFDVEDMASYDAYGAKCYVLEQGDYDISINSDSHNIIDQQTYTVAPTVVYDESNPRSSDQVAAVNQFENAEGEFSVLSRKDAFANYEEATASPSLSISDRQKADFVNSSNYDINAHDDPNAEMPTTGASKKLELKELRGRAYDDPMWEDLLDQLTINDMNELISKAGYSTVAVSSVGKISTVDCDGPASINNNFTRQSSIGFPSEIVMANTWNTDLAYAFGDKIGKMADEMGVSGWYAPAMNTHRNAFAGRNFEYYSEDPTLAGAMASNAIKAAREHGVYSYIKHFALNEQDDRRTDMLCTWVSEQALREIYLKPFETAVKKGGAQAVMSSFNYIGPLYAGSNPALLKTVLRNEWGFRGMVITDGFFGYGYQSADELVRSGNDACLVLYDNPMARVKVTSASGVEAMRTSAHNIMYTVVNSLAYAPENLNPKMETWKTIFIVVNLLAVLLVAILEIKVIIPGYKKRREDVLIETETKRK